MSSTSKIQRATSNGTAVTAIGGTTIIAAPPAGFHLEIFAVQAANISGTASLVHFLDHGGQKTYPAYLNANWPNYDRDLIGSGQPWKIPSATAFDLDQSAAGSIHYTVDYLIVSDQ